VSETLRVEVKFKNAILYNEIAKQFPPTNRRQQYADLHAAAEEAGISYSYLHSLVSLRHSPWSANGDPRPAAKKLSLMLAIDCEELFPRDLYSGVIPKMLARDIDPNRYLSFRQAIEAKLLPRSTDDLAGYPEHEILHDTVQSILKTLTPREQNILTRRFGLDGDSPETLEQIGIKFFVSRERIRSIESKALRKLRHPSRSETLADAYLKRSTGGTRL